MNKITINQHRSQSATSHIYGTLKWQRSLPPPSSKRWVKEYFSEECCTIPPETCKSMPRNFLVAQHFSLISYRAIYSCTNWENPPFIMNRSSTFKSTGSEHQRALSLLYNPSILPADMLWFLPTFITGTYIVPQALPLRYACVVIYLFEERGASRLTRGDRLRDSWLALWVSEGNYIRLVNWWRWLIMHRA